MDTGLSQFFVIFFPLFSFRKNPGVKIQLEKDWTKGNGIDYNEKEDWV